jgi:hypothetical protein
MQLFYSSKLFQIKTFPLESAVAIIEESLENEVIITFKDNKIFAV